MPSSNLRCSLLMFLDDNATNLKSGCKNPNLAQLLTKMLKSSFWRDEGVLRTSIFVFTCCSWSICEGEFALHGWTLFSVDFLRVENNHLRRERFKGKIQVSWLSGFLGCGWMFDIQLYFTDSLRVRKTHFRRDLRGRFKSHDLQVFVCG
jgi:hypothetical protein